MNERNDILNTPSAQLRSLIVKARGTYAAIEASEDQGDERIGRLVVTFNRVTDEIIDLILTTLDDERARARYLLWVMRKDLLDEGCFRRLVPSLAGRRRA